MFNKKAERPFLIFLVIFIFACNLFDLCYTVYALEVTTNTREANPLIGFLLQHPPLLIIYKFIILPLAIGYLYHSREKPVAVFGICLCAFCFGGVVLYQILMIPHWDVAPSMAQALLFFRQG